MGADIVTRFQGVDHNLAGTPTRNHSWPNHPCRRWATKAHIFVPFQNSTKAQAKLLGLFVDGAPERFELPTTWFVARYSIQLSYGRVSGDADYAD